MSEHQHAEDQDDDEYAVCPYCQHNHRIEGEDRNESGTVMECNNCDMKFHYVTNVSISHSTNGDCSLNGVDHDWINRGHYDICQTCQQVKIP